MGIYSMDVFFAVFNFQNSILLAIIYAVVLTITTSMIASDNKMVNSFGTGILSMSVPLLYAISILSVVEGYYRKKYERTHSLGKYSWYNRPFIGFLE